VGTFSSALSIHDSVREAMVIRKTGTRLGGKMRRTTHKRRYTMKHWRQIVALCLVVGVVVILALPLWAQEAEKVNIINPAIKNMSYAA